MTLFLICTVERLSNRKQVMSQRSAEVRLGKSEVSVRSVRNLSLCPYCALTAQSLANPHKHDCSNVPHPDLLTSTAFCFMIHGSTASFSSSYRGMFRVQNKLGFDMGCQI